MQSLAVKNTGERGPLSFTAALHTYFRVSDISEATVEGLKGTKYLDSLDGRKEKTEENDSVKFAEEVDRIYAAVPSDGAIKIVDGGGAGGGGESGSPSSSSGHSISLETVNLPDAVVWNPWTSKSKGMADFGDEEYKEMLCVEPAVAASGAVEVGVGKEHVCVQKLRLIV